jgi:uncharacterized protein YbjT (DUF2867 family)
MKITVTGSLGHISKPLTIELVQKGHYVTVISSSQEKQKEVEDLGAKAAIGSLEDVDFLTENFMGADAVYCMIPPNNYTDKNLDLIPYYERIANNYAQAIQNSGVKRVIYLSSIGAHLSHNSGIILGHHAGEAIMDKLENVSISFMRPVGFYYNLLGFIPMIKSQGMIMTNWGADADLVWVSPIDIASAIVEELESQPVGRKVRYVASDELTGNESAKILGEAIGKPDLEWKIIPSEQMKNGLVAVGLNPNIADGLVEMYESQQNGLLMEDYYKNRPVLGKVKLADYAKEFAKAYNS